MTADTPEPGFDDLEPRDKIASLLELSEMMDHGPAQVAVCEEAVRMADAHGDEQAGFYARKELTKAASFGGRMDLSLVAFAWCLAKVDENPDEYDEGGLLWSYKWVNQNAASFPAIPKPQILALIDDMEARFRKHGSTLHAVHMIRRDVSASMGDRAAAAASDVKFRLAERDFLSDCAACVNDSTVEYLLDQGDDVGAVAASEPALSGAVTCAEVPHRTYAYVLLPLLRLGHVERAVKCHRLGYKLIRGNPEFVRQKGYHLAFLALTGNFDRCGKIIDRHLGEAVEIPSGSARFEFYCAARLFLDRLLAAGHGGVTFRVPAEIRPLGAERMTVPQLGAWLDGQIAELAAAFDARNGNDEHAQRAAWFRDQATFAIDFPIVNPGKRDAD
ncbi:MAG: hypothetical protein ACRC7O_11135 [Fimbriiglobus sp.]